LLYRFSWGNRKLFALALLALALAGGVATVSAKPALACGSGCGC
jgi:hypothetical protein